MDGVAYVALPAVCAEVVFAGRCMHLADLELVKANLAGDLHEKQHQQSVLETTCGAGTGAAYTKLT